MDVDCFLRLCFLFDSSWYVFFLVVMLFIHTLNHAPDFIFKAIGHAAPLFLHYSLQLA